MFYANYIRERMKVPIYAEAEGNPITITNALERPIRDMKVLGESVQNDTPSPETPAEIVSVENPVLKICGKNLYDVSKLTDYSKNQFYVYDDYIEVGYGVYYGRVFLNNGNMVLPAGTYTFSAMGEAFNAPDRDLHINVRGVDTSVLPQKNVIFKSQSGGTHMFVTFTITQECEVRFSLQSAGNSSQYTNLQARFWDIQLEIGADATEYEPYIVPQSVTLDGITLRGLKNTDGNWKARDEIIVDGKKKTVELVEKCWEIALDGNKSWGVYDSIAGYEGFACWGNYGINKVLPEKYTRREPALCNQCRVNYNTMWLGVDSLTVYWVGTEARRFYDATLEDKGLANLKAHLNENPLKIVSYYTNPIETDISNTEAGQKLLELYTNRGTTNIFLNSESGLGEIWVRYVRK